MRRQLKWSCEAGQTRGTSRTNESVLVTLLALSGFGCTTTMYGGPSRDSAETAVISSGKGATIESIDRTPVNGGPLSKYEVLPGQHFVGLAGQKTDVGLFANTIHRSGRIGTCFFAQPGHRYAVRASLDDGMWTNDVVDKDSETIVEDMACGGPSESSQAGVSNAAVLLKKPHPGTGLFIGLGGEGGGSDLIRATMSTGDTKTLNAGSGYVFTLGASVMPFWIGNFAGFGVASRIGVKFDSIDAKNGSVLLVSYPFSLWVQNYLSLSARWFLSFAGGTHKELSPGLSGSGVASGVQAGFQSPWGWLVDAGALFAETWHTAIGLSVRYTSIHYSHQGKDIDASNVGAALTVHFNL